MLTEISTLLLQSEHSVFPRVVLKTESGTSQKKPTKDCLGLQEVTEYSIILEHHAEIRNNKLFF